MQWVLHGRGRRHQPRPYGGIPTHVLHGALASLCASVAVLLAAPISVSIFIDLEADIYIYILAADRALWRLQFHQGDLLGAAGGANDDGGPVGLIRLPKKEKDFDIKVSRSGIVSVLALAPLFPMPHLAPRRRMYACACMHVCM